jgi:hypothetical protein
MQNPDFVLQYVNNQKIVVDGEEKNLQTIVNNGKNKMNDIEKEYQRRQKEKSSSSNVTPEEKNEVEELKTKIEVEGEEEEGRPKVGGEASNTEIK